jgi:ketosteroid isomerase-like protein
MHRIKILTAIGILCGIATFIFGLSLPTLAKTEIPPDVETKVEDEALADIQDKTISAIRSTFTSAEKAVHAEDLVAVMSFYSKDYDYHGLKTKDIRKIWQDLFAKYRRIQTTHILSKFVLKGKGKIRTAEVTCTGTLWATSKESGKRVNIDSWFEEVHFMILEDGMWRVRGSAGGVTPSFEFGSAPHPLF